MIPYSKEGQEKVDKTDQAFAPKMSPRARGRLAALVMTFESIAAVRGHIRIPAEFTVKEDAVATADKILANPTSWQVGVTLSLVAAILHVIGALMFYELFKPVNRPLARMSLFAGFVGIALQAASAVFQAAPLRILDSPSVTSAQQSLAYTFVELQTEAANMYLIFFGVSILLLGYLIFKSGFVSRLIGALEMLAGVAYLVLLWPPLAKAWSPYYLFFAAGELILGLWLLIKGIDSERWIECERANRASQMS